MYVCCVYTYKTDKTEEKWTAMLRFSTDGTSLPVSGADKSSKCERQCSVFWRYCVGEQALTNWHLNGNAPISDGIDPILKTLKRTERQCSDFWRVFDCSNRLWTDMLRFFYQFLGFTQHKIREINNWEWVAMLRFRQSTEERITQSVRNSKLNNKKTNKNKNITCSKTNSWRSCRNH